MASGDVAGVVVASPNRYGVLENYSGWADTVHAAKALFVMTCEAAAIGAVKSVAPSYIDALDTSRPVNNAIMLWYSNIYWSVPCDISG